MSMRSALLVRTAVLVAACTTAILLCGCKRKHDREPSKKGVASDATTKYAQDIPQGVKEDVTQPPFPSDVLAAYIAETLHFIGGYPLGWKPVQMRTGQSEPSGLLAEFQPQELVSQGWVSPSYKRDRALVYFSVQRPGGLKPLLPSEALDELATLTRTIMTRDGFALQKPTVVTVEETGGKYVYALYGGRKAVVVEGIADEGTWQCSVFATDRGLTYNLNLSVKHEHLSKYRDIFKLVVTHFYVGGVVGKGDYAKTWAGLRRVADQRSAKDILFLCGLMDINQILTVSPDGERVVRLTQEGFNCARKHKQRESVFLASADGLFSVPLDRSASPQRIADLDDIMSFDINPAGTQICYASLILGNGLWIADIAKPAPTQIIKGLALTPSWSPDGTQIAFSRGKQIENFSLHGGTVTSVPNAKGHCPEWLPDGTGLVFNNEGKLMLINLGSGVISELVDTGYTSGAAVSADGRFITYAAIRKGHRDLYVWDRQTELEVMLFASSLNCDVMDW